MTVIGSALRKLLELLGNGVHCVDLPAILGEHGLDDGRGDNQLRFERDDKLQQLEIVVRSLDRRGWLEESKVGGLGRGKKVLGGL